MPDGTIAGRETRFVVNPIYARRVKLERCAPALRELGATAKIEAQHNIQNPSVVFERVLTGYLAVTGRTQIALKRF